VCHFTYSCVGYTTAATNLAASDSIFALGGGGPHGIMTSGNHGKRVLNVVTSDTATHYTSLYIKKKLHITARTTEIGGPSRDRWHDWGQWAEVVGGGRPKDRGLKHCVRV
jgi:hypothetical protein